MLLLRAYIKKEAILAKRYIVNTVGGGITLLIVFLLIFYGYSGVVGFNLGDETKEGLILSFIVWVLALSIYQNITDSIEEETKIGTIEQLYLSKYSFVLIVTTKSLAMLFIDLIEITILLLLMMNITQTFLSFSNIFSILFITFFISLNFWGLGYVLAGGVLLYKKIGTFLQVFQFLILGLMFIPVQINPLFKWIPSVWGLNLLREAITNNASLMSASLTDYFYLVIPSLLYLLIGLLIFKRSITKATEKSLLGFH